MANALPNTFKAASQYVLSGSIWKRKQSMQRVCREANKGDSANVKSIMTEDSAAGENSLGKDPMHMLGQVRAPTVKFVLLENKSRHVHQPLQLCIFHRQGSRPAETTEGIDGIKLALSFQEWWIHELWKTKIITWGSVLVFSFQKRGCMKLLRTLSCFSLGSRSAPAGMAASWLPSTFSSFKFLQKTKDTTISQSNMHWVSLCYITANAFHVKNTPSDMNHRSSRCSPNDKSSLPWIWGIKTAWKKIPHSRGRYPGFRIDWYFGNNIIDCWETSSKLLRKRGSIIKNHPVPGWGRESSPLLCFFAKWSLKLKSKIFKGQHAPGSPKEDVGSFIC